MMDNTNNTQGIQKAPDKDILTLSRRIIAQNREAYEELAK